MAGDFLGQMAMHVCHAQQASSRKPSEAVRANFALMTQDLRLVAMSKQTANATSDIAGPMAATACRAVQAAIRMQRAIHLAWLVVKDRFHLLYLQLPALDVLQELLQLTEAHVLQQTVSCAHLGRIHPLRRQFVGR